MPVKMICFGRTYPHRHWFRKNGFDWDHTSRHWWKVTSNDADLEAVATYSAGNFEVGLELLTVDLQQSKLGSVQVSSDETNQASEQIVQHPPVAKVGTDGSVDVAPSTEITNEKSVEVRSSSSLQSRECISCGEIIPEGRLRLVPTATFCTACSQATEGNYRKKIKETWGDREAFKRDRSSWKRTH